MKVEAMWKPAIDLVESSRKSIDWGLKLEQRPISTEAYEALGSSVRTVF